ncbi:MAG: hypothetical protein V8S89_06945 [Oscillospiraceae bacterium]
MREGIPHGLRRAGRPGTTHAVVEMPGLQALSFDELRPLGKALRGHPAFPKGANVNFYDLVGPDHLVEKTFERGVEDFPTPAGPAPAASSSRF